MNILTSSQKLILLRDLGLTGSEIARATGITQPTISRIERGVHANPKETAVLAIDALYRKIIQSQDS